MLPFPWVGRSLDRHAEDCRQCLRCDYIHSSVLRSLIVFHAQKVWDVWIWPHGAGFAKVSRDALSRYSLGVGLGSGLCGCFGILQWHLPDSGCSSYTTLLMLRLGVICKACVPFNGNHKSQRASEKYRARLPFCLQCFTCSFSLPHGAFWVVTFVSHGQTWNPLRFLLMWGVALFVCF